MNDSTDKPPHDDQEFAAHLGRHIRRALLALALIAAPLALLRIELFTGPVWVGTLWACQGLGLALLIVSAFRMMVGPVGQRLNAPARPVPGVPASPEVQAHQRRMDGGQDTA
ncbi:hypothetical protein LXH09_37035 [Streptomyces sp. CS7]|uniref:hypothetical protein n=1 Tax=Streptomyces sp. CS-7 TaxID=2906769 RepID=UPI0021B1A651|nr:hypothetical protein [Streptomyces sp. CS-7]MCT6782230.1 hypothetical protein [Streptomyces sp. CS-7]